MLYNNFLKELGFRIKMRRLQLGLTQAQLGEQVKMSENYISEIESGRNNITLKSLHKIFSVLKVSFFDFFNFNLLEKLE